MRGGSQLDANLALLSEMVDRPGSLANDFVFVGGCATGLLITTPRSQIIRGTAEARKAPDPVREYLRGQFSSLISTEAFISALPNHLPPDRASQSRASIVLARFKSLASSP